ncbi:DNA-binding transcriptional activator MarA [Clostridium tepidiprofundi DSM 19306]|uniref:DNA-binding transcriptional activator MarA n=1 Tax=Clostridium tepidiprofundi DSM 19306 TaxID=1121338 RepID=A0A151AN38_9CLOT|nr:hypothetical protein [Clostridium tepidiprofundi]KYH29043.1 DNA-binding transcriptional activator MarA [Clostridium tepidiprofundi DSM 19306]
MLTCIIINISSGGDFIEHSIPVKAMLEYIENRVKGELVPEEVAKATVFSHFHFRAVFKSLIGMSLAKYISLRK